MAVTTNRNPALKEKSPGELYFGEARMALLDIKSGFWSIRRQMIAMVGEKLTRSALQQAGVNGGASYAASVGAAKGVDEQERLFGVCLQALQDAGFGKFAIHEANWPIGKVVIHGQSAIEAWMTLEHGEHTDQAICAYTAGVLVGFINVITGRKDVVCVESACQAKGDASCRFELLPANQSENTPVVTFSRDPAFGRNVNLLEILFDRMPMGIALVDREYNVQRFNPTWEEWSANYSSRSAAPLTPNVNYFDHLPDTEAIVVPLFERTLSGETVRQNGVRLETLGIVSYWDIVLTPVYENNDIVGLLIVSVDATERVEARLNLEQRILDRTRELQTLLNVVTTANQSLNLDEMLKTTLDHVVMLVGASRVGVLLHDESSGRLEPRMLRPEQEITQDELSQITQACEQAITEQKNIFISTNKDRGFYEPGALLPLRIHDQSLGALVIIGKTGGQFAPEQQKLFISIADQLSVAIENARLYNQVEQAAVTMERARLARDLHDAVTQTLFSASLIAEVLPKLWEKDPEEGHRRLEEVRQLTRGALSEMRTLLLELRPTSLSDTDLVDLITHLVNAFIARTRLDVQYTKEVNGNPPSTVNEVFYRVAQETLNNIVKHARATQIEINFKCHPKQVELVIRDNGCGFNPEGIPSDHFGLEIMRERAKEIGAELAIASQPYHGTCVNLIWKNKGIEEENE